MIYVYFWCKRDEKFNMVGRYASNSVNFAPPCSSKFNVALEALPPPCQNQIRRHCLREFIPCFSGPIPGLRGPILGLAGTIQSLKDGPSNKAGENWLVFIFEGSFPPGGPSRSYITAVARVLNSWLRLWCRLSEVLIISTQNEDSTNVRLFLV